MAIVFKDPDEAPPVITTTGGGYDYDGEEYYGNPTNIYADGELVESTGGQQSVGDYDDWTLTLPKKKKNKHAPNKFGLYFANDGAPYRGPAEGVIDPTWALNEPEYANAALVTLANEDFKNRYVPLEHEALAQAQDFDFSDEAQRAGEYVSKQFDIAEDTFKRNTERFGIRPKAGQKNYTDDQFERNEALGIVNAENSTKRQLYDRNIAAIGNLASHGKGVASAAMQGLGRAGAIDSQIKAANHQAKNQRDASRVGALASGFGIAAAGGFNPVSIAVGTVVGLLGSL